MFENFIDEKIKSEKDKIAALDIKNAGDIKKTNLLPFVKKFIVRQAPADFTLNDVNFLLEKAVKLNFNYTIRPKWTLLKYLFSNYDSQRINNVLDKMEVFLYYRFYTDLIAKFINENSHIFITRKQVEDLISETNTVLYEKLVDKINGVKVKNFFIQVFRLKYDNDASINLDSTVPFVFIRIFLEDKGYHQVLARLKSKAAYEDETLISLKDLIKILTGRATEGETEFKENTKDEKAPILAGVQPQKDKKEDKPEVKPEAEPVEVKLDEPSEEKIIIDVEEDNKAQEPETSEEIYSKDLLDAGKIQVVKEEEDKLPAFTPYEPVDDTISIRRLFTKGELKDICKEVYKGVSHKMYDSFDELEKLDSWDSAAEYMKKIFIENDVDPYDKSVVLFVDILNEYFVKKEEEKA
jgi:hypothetical protein